MHVVNYEKNVESIDAQELEIVGSNRTLILGTWWTKKIKVGTILFFILCTRRALLQRELYIWVRIKHIILIGERLYFWCLIESIINKYNIKPNKAYHLQGNVNSSPWVKENITYLGLNKFGSLMIIPCVH